MLPIAQATVDTVIIGAGVVGLAIARQISNSSQVVCLLDRNSRFGTETSSRNSQVIHSGVYYILDSLKSKLCLEGNSLTHSFCEKYRIPIKRIGKLIVANTEEEFDYLVSLKEKCRILSIQSRFQSSKEIESEPFIKVKHALHIPSTSIIDVHTFMSCLEVIKFCYYIIDHRLSL